VAKPGLKAIDIELWNIGNGFSNSLRARGKKMAGRRARMDEANIDFLAICDASNSEVHSRTNGKVDDPKPVWA
jgi:hypothetical protein